ncbi:MAG: hypothetical protein Q4E35_08420 [Eubacteriales bacterium]|nr:hypothetical protein [Eubacteriales bacterium]
MRPGIEGILNRTGKGAMSYDTLLIIRLVAASVLFAVSLIFGGLPKPVSIIFLVLSAVIAGFDVGKEALSAFFEKDYFSIAFVVSAITVIAYLIGFCAEGAALVLLYQIGLLLISYAEEKSRLSALECLKYQRSDIADSVTQLVFGEYAGFTSLENTIRRSSSFILKIAMGFALLYAIALPIFTNFSLIVSIHRALIIILIAAPASVTISMPIAAVYGLCYGAKYGVIFSSAAAMEALGESETAIFDNAGLFSQAAPEMRAVKPEIIDTNTFIAFAAHTMYNSEQPVAKLLDSAYTGEYRTELIDGFEELPGFGAKAFVGGAPCVFGTRAMHERLGTKIPGIDGPDGRYYYLTVAGRYVGAMIVDVEVNADTQNLVIGLNENGMNRCVLLCEDGEAESRRIADELDFREVYSECDTEKKLRIVSDIKSGSGKGVSYFYSVGFDGHSDADIDVRVSSHSRFADVLILPESIANLPFAKELCARVKEICIENALFAFIVKAVLIFLSIIGYCNLWFAIFVDTVAAVATILNSVRVTRPSMMPAFLRRR